ncbi:MAG: ABC transporter substrate-binding protein [Desulfitobacteriaceae bacterium]
MRRRFSYLVVSVLSFVLVFASGCGNSSSSSSSSSGQKAPIRIGVTLPLSGSLASVGADNWNGLEIARQMINEKGGINGSQVEYVKADTPDPTVAVNEANRLITQEKVKLIMGAYSSPLTLAITEVTERNKTLFWEIGAMDPLITGRGYKYVFRTNPNSANYAEVGVNYLAKDVLPKLGKQPQDVRVALAFEDGSFGMATGKEAEKYVKQLGMNVVAKESYNSKAIDLSSLIMKLKDAKPDIVIAVSYINDAILFWKQARDLDFNPKVFMGMGSGHSNVAFAQARGHDTNGVMVSTPTSDINVKNLQKETQDLNKKFVEEFKAKFGKEPPTQAVTAFAGAWILFNDVLLKAGSDDPQKVRAAALSLDIPDGHTVNGWGVKFGDDGQNTRSFALVMQWQNQKLTTISPDKLALSKAIMVPLPTWGEKGK